MDPDARPGRPAEVIELGQVTLRRHRDDDLDAVFAAVTESRDHLRPFMPWAAGYTRQTANEFLTAAARRWEDGSEYGYAIVAGGVLAGGCSLMARSTPAAAWPPRRPGRSSSRRSGCPAWTGSRS
jgi:ribosomal-protein-serine acetyltransferase